MPLLLMYTAAAYLLTMFMLYMLGIAKLVQAEGRPPLSLVFLPFAHGYARAVIVGRRGCHLRTLAPLSSAVLVTALMIPNLFFFTGAALFYLITRCFLNYFTYERKKALIFTVLSLLIPFSGGAFIYYTYRKVRIPL